MHVFPEDPLNQVINDTLDDPDYKELKEIRNILVHREAPGRIFSVGCDNDPGDQWKVKNIPLDRAVSDGRANLSRLTSALLRGIDQFAKSHL